MERVPRQYGSIVCVVELEIDKADRPHWFRLLVSIPGREGTVSRTWAWEGDTPSVSQAQDLGSYIAKTVDTAIATRLGWQGELIR